MATSSDYIPNITDKDYNFRSRLSIPVRRWPGSANPEGDTSIMAVKIIALEPFILYYSGKLWRLFIFKSLIQSVLKVCLGNSSQYSRTPVIPYKETRGHPSYHFAPENLHPRNLHQLSPGYLSSIWSRVIWSVWLKQDQEKGSPEFLTSTLPIISTTHPKLS